MGFIFVVAPTIGWTWPALLPLVTAVAAAKGYQKLTDGSLDQILKSKLTTQLENLRRVEIPIDSVLAEVIAEDIGADERIAFRNDDFQLIFRKDVRGKFHVEVSGPKECSTLNLKIRGEEFAREVVRKFAYHKMVELMEKRSATIVEEETLSTGETVMTGRQWN